LQSGTWAAAVWHSAQITKSIENSFISILVGNGTRRAVTVLPDLSLLFNSIKEFVWYPRAKCTLSRKLSIGRRAIFAFRA
jgi:hypothetical protein